MDQKQTCVFWVGGKSLEKKTISIGLRQESETSSGSSDNGMCPNWGLDVNQLEVGTIKRVFLKIGDRPGRRFPFGFSSKPAFWGSPVLRNARSSSSALSPFFGGGFPYLKIDFRE